MTKAAHHRHWETVRAALAGAESAGWDGCHKIYIYARGVPAGVNHHSHRIQLPETSDPDTIDKAAAILCSWYEESCSLRMIDVVRHAPSEPHGLDITGLIEQFEDEENADNT